MSRKHLYIVGQGKHSRLQGMNQRSLISSRKVASAYLMTEKAISAKEHVLFLLIEADSAWSVSRSFYHAKLHFAHLDYIAIFKVLTHGRERKRIVEVKELTHLLSSLLIRFTFVSAKLYIHSISIVHKLSTKYVIEVTMRVKQVGQLQMMCCDKIANSLSLFWMKSTTINENRLLLVVPRKVAVLLYHVYNKTSDLHIFCWCSKAHQF